MQKQPRVTRVALFLPDLGVGGAETLVLNLIREFLRHPEFAFHLILLGSGGKMARGVKEFREHPAFFFHELGLPLESGLTPALHLRRYLAAHRIDILHSHLYVCDKVAFVLKFLRPRTAVLSTKHSTMPLTLKVKVMNFISQFLFCRIVFISALQREHYRRKSLIILNASIIENGCVIPSQEPAVRPLSENGPHFACIGSLRPEKGQDVLIKALGILSREGIRYRCDFYGDGPNRDALQAGTPLGADIRFFPALPGISGLLTSFDAVIIPSRREGFGLLLFECFLAKTPVIVSDYPILAEHAGRGSRAIIFENGNFLNLAEKLRIFIEDPRACVPLTEAGYRYGRGFSIEKTAAQYLDLYRNAGHMSLIR